MGWWSTLVFCYFTKVGLETNSVRKNEMQQGMNLFEDAIEKKTS